MKASDILEKAIVRAQCIDLKKAVSDGLKKCHDAMYHHALHAEAANRAGKKEEAKKHMLALMRHALENVKDRDMYGIKNGIADNVNHYSREASESLLPYGWGDQLDKQGQKLHPATKHFKEGGKFVPHKGDKKIVKDLKKAWSQIREEANNKKYKTSEGGLGDYWNVKPKQDKPWKSKIAKTPTLTNRASLIKAMVDWTQSLTGQGKKKVKSSS